MSGYSELKSSINRVIKTNDNREITGQILQNTLNSMVNSLGANYHFSGIASPITNPGTPDQNIFYVTSEEGTYVNFDRIELGPGLSFLLWRDNQWSYETLSTGDATKKWVQENYVSIDFFRSLFRAYDENDTEILPNNNPEGALPAVVDNIKAMVGFWTEQYLSALGHGPGGGGGGGGSTTLDGLDDVELTSPLASGQVLTFDAISGKWVNGRAGTDIATVWTALAGNTSEQINISHLTDALADYATKTYVEQNFITVAYFDRLFHAYNGNTLINHNDVSSTIDNIKAMFGFWTDFYLSALGNNSQASDGITLDMLSDVTINNPSLGQVLTYNGSRWVNQTISVGATELSSLSDVILTSLQNGQTLLYDSTTSKWYNSALKTINGQSLLGSGDISVGGGASGNYLPLTGGTLTNSTSTAILSLNNTSSQGSWIYFYWKGTLYGSVAYFDNLTCIADEGTGYRIGVNTNGTPVFRMGVTQSSTTYELLHAGNWSRFINPYLSNQQPGYEVSLGSGSWSWYRLTSGSIYWDIATNDIYNQYQAWGIGGFGIRQKGANHNGIYIRYDTSSYGKLVVAVPSGECTLGFAVDGTNKWTIGYTGSNDEFGWFYSMSNVGGNYGWKMTLNPNGTLYCVGGMTALSDIRYKDIQEYVSLDVQNIADAPAVRFTWKDGKDKATHVGSIAQYWDKILPESVIRTSEGRLSMQYGVAALVSAIVTARKVVDHERRIHELEKENERLKEEVSQLRLN